MIKIITIIGARPQIIKSAAISRVIKNKFNSDISEIIIHTGQHYDKNMSDIFIKELNISRPDYNLSIGSGTHGKQTARMIEEIEKVLQTENPNCIILYGDTNSTLAGAVAASKLKIPVAHVEAGLRSYKKHMPEEINRIVSDHASTFLFSPTQTGIDNLLKEGFKINPPPFHIDNPGIFLSGDVMYDNSLYYSKIAAIRSDILKSKKLTSKEYILTTIHRENNTDELTRLTNLLSAFIQIYENFHIPIFLPIHPRTLKTIDKLDLNLINRIRNCKGLLISEPAPFFDILILEKNAKIIITDSGGVQKEAFFNNVPSIILRSETEWIEIIENDAGKLVDADINNILNATEYYLNNNIVEFKPIFGNGKASEYICTELIKALD